MGRLYQGLTDIGSFPIGGYNPGPITTNHSGSFLYLNVIHFPPTTQNTSGFSIDQTTGKLTSLSGSPFSVPSYSLAINSFDTFGYSIDQGDNKIAILRDDPKTEVLTLKSELSNPALTAPTCLVRSNTFLYISDYNAGVFVIKANNATGRLTIVQQVPGPAPSNPVVIAITR